jgi:hypothetical protein
MISFAQYLKPEDVEATRACVIREAQREKRRLASPEAEVTSGVISPR